MPERHHIFNFHIGFWGSLLISFLVMVQSALLLLMTSGITLAQPAPFISISKPTSDVQVIMGDDLPLEATVPSGTILDVTFEMKNTADQSIVPITALNVDSIKHTASWFANNLGTYQLTAKIFDSQGNLQVTAPQITVNVVLSIPTINLWAPRQAGITINAPYNLEGTTDPKVDSLKFLLQPVATGSSAVFTATPTDTTKRIWHYLFDPVQEQIAPGNYTIMPIATLNGLDYPGSDRQIVVDLPTTQETITIQTPTGANSTLVGQVDFTAVTSKPAAPPVIFTITDLQGSQVAEFNGIDLGQKTNWNNLFDTTTIPNNTDTTAPYFLIVSTTINNKPVFSDSVTFLVDNGVVAGPPIITTTQFFDATVGTDYTGRVNVTGGTPPYNFSISLNALPSGLTITGADSPTTTGGLITGIPTTEGTFSFTVRVTDSADEFIKKTLSITVAPDPTALPPDTNVPPVDPTAPPADPNAPAVVPVFNITDPTTNKTIFGDNILIKMVANIPVSAPQLILANSNGQNVLQGQTAASFKPFGQADDTIWHFLLNSNSFENGAYTLLANTTQVGATESLASQVVNITIDNPLADQLFGGRIISPNIGQRIAGIVKLQASVSKPLLSVMFKITPSDDITRRIPATLNITTNIWEAPWDSVGLPAGSVTIGADIITEDNKNRVLPTIEAVLIATVVTQAPATTDANPVLDNNTLQNVTADGVVSTLPVECQVANIVDPQACKKYLEIRKITILDEGDQTKLRDEQLPQVLTRYINVSDNAVTKKDFFTTPKKGSEKEITDPLAGIIPLNKEKIKDISLLVLTSTEPPAILKPFVQQTVPALLVFDQDGDGLSDEAEVRYGTDPLNPDTDGDGFDDGTEIKNGFSPFGPGLLQTKLAPIDSAILNKRPIDQPRFAGIVDEENITVSAVGNVGEVAVGELPVKGEGLIFKGKAEPNSVVTLFIYSTLPILVTTTVDANGNWQYDLSHPLTDGKHDVYATVTSETGKIIKKSQPLAFFVDTALAVNEEQFLSGRVQVIDPSARFIYYYIVGGLLVILLGGVLFFYYLRQRVTIE